MHMIFYYILQRKYSFPLLITYSTVSHLASPISNFWFRPIHRDGPIKKSASVTRSTMGARYLELRTARLATKESGHSTRKSCGGESFRGGIRMFHASFCFLSHRARRVGLDSLLLLVRVVCAVRASPIPCPGRRRLGSGPPLHPSASLTSIASGAAG